MYEKLLTDVNNFLFIIIRRKNLAVHLGLDDKTNFREIQKINTYCLPVPATTFEEPAEASSAIAGETEVASDDVKVKRLMPSFRNSIFIKFYVEWVANLKTRG